MDGEAVEEVRRDREKDILPHPEIAHKVFVI